MYQVAVKVPKYSQDLDMFNVLFYLNLLIYRLIYLFFC